jgi:two-component system alkaline phosphatase synthesis response regulator PhoP
VSETNQRILLIEDDKNVVRLLRTYLEDAGYEVQVAYDGDIGVHMLRSERPNLVLLDLMLPNTDGWEITRIIRGDDALRSIPIIMLTARVEDTDKILGLEFGADDYITKPFNPREVLARIRVVLRRGKDIDSGPPTPLQYNQISLDTYSREVRLAGEVIDLTPIEYDLLLTMMQSIGYVFTRAELIERGLDHTYAGMDRSLDTHIKNLRKKIEPNPKEPTYIQTVYGVGYRFGQRGER